MKNILSIAAIASMGFIASSADANILLRRNLGHMPPKCYIEEGYDFVDNDIGSQKAAKAEDCCEICYTTGGCKAFSWNNYNGGTCWLKSGRGTVIVKEGVRSALVFGYPGPDQCKLDAGIDYVDFDIGTAPSADAKGCCDVCAKKPGCRAFSWNGYSGGTCYLKSAKGKTVVNPYVTSGQAYPDPTANSCALQQGFDFVGNDLEGKPGKLTECCDICSAYTGCRAWSWTNYNGGTCWLKNLVLDTVALANVVSCQMNVNPAPPSCSLENGVDYVDNDIGIGESKDAYGCCSMCLKLPNCKAFSWTNTNGGTCYFKSAKGSTVANPNVISAIV